MKYYIISLLLCPLFMSAQIKYSVVVGDDYIQVDANNVMDTLAAPGVTSGEYVAILEQANTGAPVAKVLKNTIGENIVWTYTTTGTYTGTIASGRFKEGKTFCTATLQQRGANPRNYVLGRATNNTVVLSAMNSTFTSTDPATTNAIAISIEIYQ